MAGVVLGGGRVELELDGRQCSLVPSLEACDEISKMAGGLRGAHERCLALNFATIVGIVGVGIEVEGNRLNPRQRADMLPKAVYEAGLIDIAAKCIEFIQIIGRGGKALGDDEDDDGEAGEEGGAPLAQ